MIPYKHITILLAVTTAIFAILYFHSQHTQQFTQQSLTLLQSQADSISYYRDQYGTLHAEKRYAEGQLTAVKTAYQQELDSLTTRLSIKERQLKSLTLIGSHTVYEVKLQVDTVYRDTGQAYYSFQYRDEWLHFAGDIGNTDSVHYTMRDSLAITTYWRRHWLLGRKTYYADVYSYNPHTTIAGLTQVAITDKKKPVFWYGMAAGALGALVGYRVLK